MSLWGSFWDRARDVFDKFTAPSPSSTRRRRRRRRDRDRPGEPEPRITGDDFGSDTGSEGGESRLPPGWAIVGLYHDGEKTAKMFATDDTGATDSEISRADAIIVQFTDAGEDGYRWIHGATGWDSVSDQIDRTVKVVSPTGRGE